MNLPASDDAEIEAAADAIEQVLYLSTDRQTGRGAGVRAAL